MMSLSVRVSLLAILALGLSTTVSAAREQSFCAPDPFLDPAHDLCNPLRYIPSNTLTGVTLALYLVCALAMSFHMWRRGAVWMAAMVIGSYTFAIGLAFRFPLHANPHAKGTYIAEYILVVLSPCAFIAAVYVLLGRLAGHLGMEKHLLISPKHITKVFVTSDVVTFLIQAIGGSVSISGNTGNNRKLGDNGTHIFLAGLALQLVSFFCFTLVYLTFLHRVRKHAPSVWKPTPAPVWWKHWHTLAVVMFISCIGILIRSFYRTIELSQGFNGHLATTEGFFYGLDTYPLLLAIMVYIPFWPSQFIDGRPRTRTLGQGQENSMELEEQGSEPEKNPE